MFWTRQFAASASLAALAAWAIPAKAGDVAYGEYLSSSCVTCHQIDGIDHGIPSIVGWPEDAMVAVLTAYKTKDRDNPVMQTIATGLGEDEMAALAAYFASLRPATDR